LEGEYEFLSGGENLRAVAGSLIYVPKGTLHAHKNIGEGAGRMLVSQTPGGLYERFFEEVGAPVKSGSEPLAFEDQLALQRLIAIAAHYGIEIPTPVPQQNQS
jgi:cupin domain